MHDAYGLSAPKPGGKNLGISKSRKSKAKAKGKARAKPFLGQDLRVSASELPRHALPIEVQIESPDGVRAVATKTLRDAPLDRLYARRQIDDCMYSAGDFTRNLFELFGGDGVRAMDFAKPYVDSGNTGAIGITDAQLRAAKRLKVAREFLGVEGFKLICDVLGRRKFIEQVAQERGMHSDREQRYLARRFRECLDTLSILYGFKVSGADGPKVRDAHSNLAQNATNPELHRALTAARDAERLNAAARTALREAPIAAPKLQLPGDRAA